MNAELLFGPLSGRASVRAAGGPRMAERLHVPPALCTRRRRPYGVSAAAAAAAAVAAAAPLLDDGLDEGAEPLRVRRRRHRGDVGGLVVEALEHGLGTLAQVVVL
mmetsp:Transcript_44355/g.92764  ORF Transcript_44355/g.92764 Transcript_44355/m.92764 type:complete len:105 (-) Transcript_44355:83-397(-)